MLDKKPEDKPEVDGLLELPHTSPEDVPLAEKPVEEPEGVNVRQELTPQQISDMDAAYRKLQNDMINSTVGHHPLVAMAASMATAGTIAVGNIKEQQDAEAFMYQCFNDTMSQLRNAYTVVHPGAQTDGADAGSESKEVH